MASKPKKPPRGKRPMGPGPDKTVAGPKGMPRELTPAMRKAMVSRY